MKRIINAALRIQINGLMREGLNLQEIAKELKVNYNVVYSHAKSLKKKGIKMRAKKVSVKDERKNNGRKPSISDDQVTQAAKKVKEGATHAEIASELGFHVMTFYKPGFKKRLNEALKKLDVVVAPKTVSVVGKVAVDEDRELADLQARLDRKLKILDIKKKLAELEAA